MKKQERFKVTTEVPQVEDFDGEELLNLYDINNPDIGFFNMLDEEAIRLSGSKLLYYKYYQGEQEFNPVYMESKSKPISKTAINVVAHYEPSLLEENLTQFGIEITNDQLFTFNKNYIETKLKRYPIPGDIVQPTFQNIKYEIFEVQEDSFEIYGVYHLVCTAKILRDTEEILDRNITKSTDNLGGYSRL
jgi:hypothetical protein